uniref:Uncharacterized protein n=1 Tax=Glossina palpalis gambiensis TaxID=67801 RepID=A0A1B0B062_9MUSC
MYMLYTEAVLGSHRQRLEVNNDQHSRRILDDQHTNIAGKILSFKFRQLPPIPPIFSAFHFSYLQCENERKLFTSITGEYRQGCVWYAMVFYKQKLLISTCQSQSLSQTY